MLEQTTRIYLLGVNRGFWLYGAMQQFWCLHAAKPGRRFSKMTAFLGLFLICAGTAGVASAGQPKTLPELQQAISNHIAQPKFAAATWGIKVVSLDTGKTLYENSPGKLFSPASNSKLYTVALGLDRLGEDYRIRTSLYTRKQPTRRGTLAGDLIIYGRGDPTINSRLNEKDIVKALEPLVSALTNAGVRRIKGDLIADESFFTGPEWGSGWSWDDAQYYYGAPISALTINDNIVQVSVKPGVLGDRCRLELQPATDVLRFENQTRTVSKDERRTIRFYRPTGTSVVHVFGQLPEGDPGYTDDLTLPRPAEAFALWFRAALERHKVKVAGKVRVVAWLERQGNPFRAEEYFELGSVQSLPMRDLAREIQKPSQNLYTDLLLAHVGEVRRGGTSRSGRYSEDLGIAELNQFLEEIGIPKGHVLFEEGSGLSRNNITTPEATIALLQHMSRHPAAEAFLEALPIAGVDGTLRRRLVGTAAEKNLRAKTGTLRWANSLSGHVTTGAGERLIFSIMLNRYYNQDPAITARMEIDKIATWLAEFKGRSAGE